MLTATLRFGSSIALVVLAFVGCGSESRDNGGSSATGGVGAAATSAPSTAGGSDAATPTTAKSDTGSGGSSGTFKSGTGGSGGSTKGSASSSASGGQASSASSGTTQSGGTSSSGSKSKGSSSAQGGNSSSSAQGGSSPTSSSNTSAQGGNATPCTSFGAATKAGTMESESAADSILTQTSGIVASREQANVLYTLTDSDKAEIYVMEQTGTALGTIALSVTPDDWEGLSMGVVADGPDLIYVADIGDNSSNRASIAIYRFPEPSKTELAPTRALSITQIESAKLVYPSGAKNAEAMFVDPKTQDIIIATKDQGTATVYRAPSSAFGSASTTLEEVGKISMNSQISAGDISSTGDLIIFRTYDSMLLFPRLGTWKDTFAATGISIPAPDKAADPQSEGVTFTSDGSAWLSAGEQVLTIYEGVRNCQ